MYRLNNKLDKFYYIFFKMKNFFKIYINSKYIVTFYFKVSLNYFMLILFKTNYFEVLSLFFFKKS